MHRYVLALFILVVFFLSIPLPAHADDGTDAAWNAAYSAVIKNPTDQGLNQRYLDLCIEREDYEAAIAPIERMLAKNPNDVALIFKLGQLYQKLNSEKVAQTYFKKVANHPAASAELRAEATSLIQSQE